MADEVQVFEMIGGSSGNDDVLPVNFLAHQTIDIGGAASAAFNGSTTQVAVVSTTSCVIEFGSAPDGNGRVYPIVAGHVYRFDARSGMKVIAAAGTVTAPSVTDTLLPPRPISIPVNGQTYSAAFSAYAAYATPTDLVTLTGSDTKTVVVTSFVIGIQTTASALQTLDLLRRSTASTGGTATTLTAALYDSTQSAATAVAKIWTAAPTLGDSAGLLKTIVAASSTLSLGPTLLGINFTNNTLLTPQLANDFRRPIILRGAAESINLNYKGAALTAGFSACGFIEWTEY